MEDKIYTFYLHASCEDAKSDSKFSYSVSLNLYEIKIHTSNQNDYIVNPDKMLEIEQRLKDQEKDGTIKNVRFQNKVNIKIENGQYKIIQS